MDINKILLSGRVLNDPTAGEQFFVASNGQAVIRIQLLVKREVKTDHDKYDSGLVSLIGFNKIAKRIYRNVKKGERILVTARFSLKEKHSQDIVIEDFDFLENKKTVKEIAEEIANIEKEEKKVTSQKTKTTGVVISSEKEVESND